MRLIRQLTALCIGRRTTPPGHPSDDATARQPSHKHLQIHQRWRQFALDTCYITPVVADAILQQHNLLDEHHRP